MKRLLVLAVLVGVVSVAHAQNTENPYKKAKKGDWVEYAMTTQVAGMNIDGKIRTTVTEKSATEATIKTVPTLNGMELPGETKKVDLTKPFDPVGLADLPKDVKVQKTGDGKETIKVAGKEYAATWQKLKGKAKQMGLEYDFEMTVWIAGNAPLSGMLKMKMVSKIGGQDVVVNMELKDSGSGN